MIFKGVFLSIVILEVNNVTKLFGNKIAVNNVSFEIHEGEVFGLLGPSGSGKTILMRMICGLSKITRGNIYICNHSIREEYEKAVVNVGSYIEAPKLYENLTGYKNLKFFASFYKDIKNSDIVKYARLVGIEHELNKKVKYYDKSSKQRLSMAQAIIHSPKLLIFDEPFLGLDVKGIREIKSLLKLLASHENIAILISSKMLGEMEDLCSTIGVMNNGQMVEIKTIGEIKSSSESSKKIKITIDYPNFAGKIIINEFKLKTSVAGNSIIVYNSDEKILERIVQRFATYKINVFKIEYITKSLEQIFAEIIFRQKNNKNWMS